MMGERTVMQESLFYGFSLEDHVPADHLLRSIDRFVISPAADIDDACLASQAAMRPFVSTDRYSERLAN